MNRVYLVGRLGKDPELKAVSETAKVCNFSLATSEGKDKVEWHSIQAWDKQAENCAKFISKGSLVAIEGRLKTRSYEKQGVTVYTTEVIASHVEFLSSPKQKEEPATTGTRPAMKKMGMGEEMAQVTPTDMDDNLIPF
jgi:single-strand DNA-binding protein